MIDCLLLYNFERLNACPYRCRIRQLTWTAIRRIIIPTRTTAIMPFKAVNSAGVKHVVNTHLTLSTYAIWKQISWYSHILSHLYCLLCILNSCRADSSMIIRFIYFLSLPGWSVTKCLKSLYSPSPATVNADSFTLYALLLSRFSSS